jgi:hypothetical protein
VRLPHVARLALGTALVIAFGAPGCSPVTPSLDHGSMSATVDGVPWTATTALTATFDGTVLTLSGSDGTTTLALSVTNDDGTPLKAGTVAINTSSTSNATLTIKTASATQTLTAGAVAGSGGGPVRITSLTSATAVGTFALVFASSGINGGKAVTDGTFSVKF